MHRLLVFFAFALPAAAQAPTLVRVYPLGGQAGATTTIELLGARLSNVTGIAFDCQDLVWKRTIESRPGRVAGEVAIAPDASLGAHSLHAITQDGPSNSVIFNVGQFPSLAEVEPNDQLDRAQTIGSLPVEVQGRLDGAPDIDVFSFAARAGERLVFDLRSIEDGSAVEVRMHLLDADGKQIAYNDDRDDYNENPLIEHTFAAAGNYYIKLDQYRGPRGFNFGKLSAYTLRISSLPVVRAVSPLAFQRGAPATLRISGSRLDSIQRVYLTQLRQAEHARMTYPYTTPIAFRADPPTAARVPQVQGGVTRAAVDSVEVAINIPDDAALGLYALWGAGRDGTIHAMNVTITEAPTVSAIATLTMPQAVNGALAKAGEKDIYRYHARAGQPLHFWTLSAQLGGKYLDTVLTLRDAGGAKLAENDDVVAGQGTLLGNPDSSLFYTPKTDGPVFVEVRDRLRRGGLEYVYSLHVASERPGFMLFTTPENFTVPRGGKADIKVHLVHEAGFEGPVDIWFDGLPAGVTAPKHQFRADQLFEPNADGADMIIPEISLSVGVPESVAPGNYAIRILGASAQEPKRIAEAHATLMIGPLLDAWNFIRRPLPAITMSVVQPFSSALLTDVKTLRLERGKSATLELEAQNVPGDTSIRLLDLPDGVRYKVIERQGTKVTVALEASDAAATGAYEIAAEADVQNRRAASPPISLSIHSQQSER